MAKLSARGRTVLAGFTKQTRPDDTNDGLGFRNFITTKRFMSDGVILAKQTAYWKDTGKQHSWGWKVHAKLAPDKLEEWKAAKIKHGWTPE